MEAVTYRSIIEMSVLDVSYKKSLITSRTKQVKVNLRKKCVNVIWPSSAQLEIISHHTELIWLYPASLSSVRVDLIKLFSELSSWSCAPNVCCLSINSDL